VTPERAVHSSPSGAFTSADGGARWIFHGALTMVLEAADALPLPSKGIVDFRGLLQADSAALAVMIALKRRASVEGRTLMLTSLPEAIKSLAIVYGVEKLIA